MDTIISEKEVEDIFNNCDKIIKEDIKWTQKNDKKYTIEFTVPIEVNYPGKFVLIGTYNYCLERFTFAILYNNEYRIKALDIGKGHKNPDKNELVKNININGQMNIKINGLMHRMILQQAHQ